MFESASSEIPAMPTPSHLEIHAPSTTTIDYVVSNKKHPTSKTVTVFRHAIRVVILANLVLVNLMKAEVSGLLEGSRWLSILSHLSLLQPLFSPMVTKADWWTLMVANVVIGFLCLRRAYTGEHEKEIAFFRVIVAHVVYRRVFTGATRLGDPDFNLLSLLLCEPDHDFHTYHQDSRHRHSRSV
jgi:hypothetical protein